MSSAEENETRPEVNGVLHPPIPFDEPAIPAVCIMNDEVAPYEEPKASSLEAAEHQATAKALKLLDIHQREMDSTYKLAHVLTGGKSIPLEFGRIISLAGDFFTNREPTGVPNHSNYPPICGALFPSRYTAKERFKNAVDSLRFDQDHTLVKLTDVLESEHNAVNETLRQEESVAHAYHSHAKYDSCSIPTDTDFADATAWAGVTPMIYLYAWIAFTNPDHFGHDAVMVYSVGHGCAINIAREARSKVTEAERTQHLNLAYFYEAFAAHYLTDLFSAGHLRAPRRLLHTSSWGLMNDSVLKGKIGEWLGASQQKIGSEKPIWDHHNRYMHDDDSATGLLVKNELGHQWIEYGDKQFFEPKNVVGRARAVQCLQISVREVYDIGFSQGQTLDPDLWKTNAEGFAAIKLIPQPMIAIKDAPWTASWGGYDMHNPAPLWRAEKAADAGDQCGWTYRRDINDHSDFGQRNSGTPSPLGMEANDGIKHGTFRGDDQFPMELTMTGLLSGGFIQVQDLDAGDLAKGTCVNFWNPVIVEIAETEHESFTIRNRVVDLPVSGTDQTSASLPLHWAKGTAQDGETSIFHFGMVKDKAGDASSLFFTKHVFSQDRFKAPPNDIPECDGTRARLSLGQTKYTSSWSWSMERRMAMMPVELFSSLPGLSHSANTTRFLIGHFTHTNKESVERDVVAVNLAKNEGVRIALCSFSPEIVISHHSFPELMRNHECFGFVKSCNKANGKNSIILLKARWLKAKTIVDCVQLTLNDSETPSMTKSTVEFKSNESPQDASMLVGDVFGQSRDQVVVIAGTLVDTSIAAFGHVHSATPAASTLELCGTHKCSMTCDFPLVRPYMTALIASTTSNPGCDILQITLHRKNESRYLVFRTHFRSADGPGADKKTWAKCRETEPYLDSFASSPSHQYFHIRWQRCRYRSDDGKESYSGVLEIFSWYGILGIRLFGAGKSGWDYSIIGQQPYLGQTSIGAGLGCTGDWGHGFLTWNDGDEWIDANIFKPRLGGKDDLTAGRWGMSWDDLERESVRGWEIAKRPGY